MVIKVEFYMFNNMFTNMVNLFMLKIVILVP